MKKIIFKIINKLFPNVPKMTCCGCLPERFAKCPYKPKEGEYNLYCYCYNMENRECNDFVTYLMKLREIQLEEMAKKEDE